MKKSQKFQFLSFFFEKNGSLGSNYKLFSTLEEIVKVFESLNLNCSEPSLLPVLSSLKDQADKWKRSKCLAHRSKLARMKLFRMVSITIK